MLYLLGQGGEGDDVSARYSQLILGGWSSVLVLLLYGRDRKTHHRGTGNLITWGTYQTYLPVCILRTCNL